MEEGDLIDKSYLKRLENEARIYGLNLQEIRKSIDEKKARLTKLIRDLREKSRATLDKDKAKEYESDKMDFIKLRRYYVEIRKTCVEYNSRLYKMRRRLKRLSNTRYYTEADARFIDKYSPEDYQTFIQKYYKKFVKG